MRENAAITETRIWNKPKKMFGEPYLQAAFDNRKSMN